MTFPHAAQYPVVPNNLRNGIELRVDRMATLANVNCA